MNIKPKKLTCQRKHNKILQNSIEYHFSYLQEGVNTHNNHSIHCKNYNRTRHNMLFYKLVRSNLWDYSNLVPYNTNTTNNMSYHLLNIHFNNKQPKVYNICAHIPKHFLPEAFFILRLFSPWLEIYHSRLGYLVICDADIYRGLQAIWVCLIQFILMIYND